jgi:ABC-type cobalamin/Fe3+-siderophores transport system ATPase subunit
MIELLKISHSYDNIKIINDLSLNIQDEGITVISGANGSGKTTLLKIISKILIPDFGIVKISNESLYKKRVAVPMAMPRLSSVIIRKVDFLLALSVELRDAVYSTMALLISYFASLSTGQLSTMLCPADKGTRSNAMLIIFVNSFNSFPPEKLMFY